jgi:aryl-alcohol dehydrogenase-like predicted oxidoreductase
LEHRKLGNSSLELPVVTFGAWAVGGLFWGGSDDKAAVDAIRAAIDHGVDAIDTAPIYGRGHSEKVVGEAIRGRRDRVKVLTKCGIRWDTTDGDFHLKLKDPDGSEVTAYRTLKADSILYECEQSLKRLGIETIDLYQIHAPATNATAEETMGAMVKLKEQGKIREIGVSNYNSQRLTDAMKFAPVVSNQIKYNLLERGIEANELPACREHGLGVIAFSPMALGILTGKVGMDRTFPDTDIRFRRKWYEPQNRKRVLDALERVRPIAERHKATLSQLAVAWVIAQPGLTTALVGARNAQQAIQNAAAGDVRLSVEDAAAIRRVFEEMGEPEDK